jgi:hypothetical protein
VTAYWPVPACAAAVVLLLEVEVEEQVVVVVLVVLVVLVVVVELLSPLGRVQYAASFECCCCGLPLQAEAAVGSPVLWCCPGPPPPVLCLRRWG